jgi:CheY-like chemotaxis protein
MPQFAKGNKVVVIENDAMNMMLAVDVLEFAGYCVFQATTVEEGIERSLAENPELVLTDLGLPGIEGFAVPELIRSHAALRDIPIIAWTAYALTGDRQRALDAGCDGYLSKPTDINELIAEVRKHMAIGRTAA